MAISLISVQDNHHNNLLLNPKTTGYIATTSLGLALYSGVKKNTCLRNTHKPFAIIATVFTAIHIGLVEYFHKKYINKK